MSKSATYEPAVETTEHSPPCPKGSRWRLGGYRAATRLVELARRASNMMDVCAEGVSLGLLRPGDVERVVFDAYDAEPDFYDPASYRPPFETEEVAIARELRALASGDRLLDAFCGQGREARTFSEHGFDVTAIDRLPVMVARAEHYAAKAGFLARFIVADFETYAPDSGFDVVYTSAWMYSTFQGRERRLRFLRRCRSLCAAGGLIVISYKTRLPEQRLHFRLRHALARTTSVLTQGNQAVELGDRLYYGLFWHHFDEAVVTEELSHAGLDTVLVRNPKDGQLVTRVLRPTPAPVASARRG